MNNSSKERNRHRAIEDEYVFTLLNSVTGDQMRSALMLLQPGERYVARDNEDLKNFLLERNDTQSVCAALLDMEARTPLKHFYVVSLDSSPSWDTGLKSKLNEVFSLGRQSSITFRLSYIRKEDQLTSLTFEHQVETRDWVLVDRTHKELRETVIRHPIIVRVDPALGLVTLSFPGFTQGGAFRKKDRLNYETVIEQLSDILSQKFGLNLSGLRLRDTLSGLSEAGSPRVQVAECDLESSGGRLRISSGSELVSVQSYLNKVIASGISSKNAASQLRSAISEAINVASANSVLCYWVREEIFTRVQFWEVGAEFYIIWNKANRSFSALNGILKLISRVESNTSGADSAQLFDFLRKQDSDEVVRPVDLVNRFGVSKKVANDVLLSARLADLVYPVFRLASVSEIEDYVNWWIETPALLRREFRTVDNEILDGGDPENVEVAFKRVKTVGEIK